MVKASAYNVGDLGSIPGSGRYPDTSNPVIPHLGIYPKKTIIQKDTRTPMFTAALFTIARTWKQPRCPWTEEKDMVLVHNAILLSHTKE